MPRPSITHLESKLGFSTTQGLQRGSQRLLPAPLRRLLQQLDILKTKHHDHLPSVLGSLPVFKQAVDALFEEFGPQLYPRDTSTVSIPKVYNSDYPRDLYYDVAEDRSKLRQLFFELVNTKCSSHYHNRVQKRRREELRSQTSHHDLVIDRSPAALQSPSDISSQSPATPRDPAPWSTLVTPALTATSTEGDTAGRLTGLTDILSTLETSNMSGAPMARMTAPSSSNGHAHRSNGSPLQGDRPSKRPRPGPASPTTHAGQLRPPPNPIQPSAASRTAPKPLTIIEWAGHTSKSAIFSLTERCDDNQDVMQLLKDAAPAGFEGRLANYHFTAAVMRPVDYIIEHGYDATFGQDDGFELLMRAQKGDAASEELVYKIRVTLRDG